MAWLMGLNTRRSATADTSCSASAGGRAAGAGLPQGTRPSPARRRHCSVHVPCGGPFPGPTAARLVPGPARLERRQLGGEGGAVQRLLPPARLLQLRTGARRAGQRGRRVHGAQVARRRMPKRIHGRGQACSAPCGLPSAATCLVRCGGLEALKHAGHRAKHGGLRWKPERKGAGGRRRVCHRKERQPAAGPRPAAEPATTCAQSHLAGADVCGHALGLARPVRDGRARAHDQLLHAPAGAQLGTGRPGSSAAGACMLRPTPAGGRCPLTSQPPGQQDPAAQLTARRCGPGAGTRSRRRRRARAWSCW